MHLILSQTYVAHMEPLHVGLYFLDNLISLQCGRPGFDPWVGKIPWKSEWQPIPVFWPGEFHGLYSPWGRKVSDMTWATSTLTFRRTLCLTAWIPWKLAWAHSTGRFWCFPNLLGIKVNNSITRGSGQPGFVTGCTAGQKTMVCQMLYHSECFLDTIAEEEEETR